MFITNQNNLPTRTMAQPTTVYTQHSVVHMCFYLRATTEV